MRVKHLLFCAAFLICAFTPTVAQDSYVIASCSAPNKSERLVGGRYALSLPKNAIIKKGRDVDYSDYSIGYGKKKNRVWLFGIFGPLASSGKVPDDWLSASVEVVRRTWKRGEFEGVDAKGKLANGNHWRYFGQFGESISYHDVPAEAAAYFDNIIDTVCFREWKFVSQQRNN